ncbi:uncharacterized protein [Leptinotarsa decemlineata]|uniref:uncharacterized protein n=1 Tax=Leptinotarsa decemlineata TaxID=7539 RepID=UPI003D308689
MFVLKSIIALSGLLGILGASIFPPAENIFQCLVADNYTLIYNETIFKDAIEDEVSVAIVNFPGEYKTNDQPIACVRITNLNPGDGGEVKTMTEAVFAKKLFAIITSGVGQRLDYLVYIYTASYS